MLLEVSPAFPTPPQSAFWRHDNISGPATTIGEETNPRHAAPVAVPIPGTGASASVMSAQAVAEQGSKQKKSEWENLLGAAHLELRAQEAGPVLKADTANANARVPYSNARYSAGANRHEAAAATSSTGLGFTARSTGPELATHSTKSRGGGTDANRGTVHIADRDDANSLLANRPKAVLGHGSMADPATCASTGATIRPKPATANGATEDPCPVGLPNAPSRVMVARRAQKTESRLTAVSSTMSAPVVPSTCGMVAPASSGILVEEEHGNVRVQTSDAASESHVRLAHPRVKGMGKRGPLGQSHFKGVSITRAGTWRAVIYKGRKQQYLGVFDSEFDAARAYDAAALRLFPEGAPLNNPDVVERQLYEISAADGKPIATAGTPNVPHEEESPQA